MQQREAIQNDAVAWGHTCIYSRYILKNGYSSIYTVLVPIYILLYFKSRGVGRSGHENNIYLDGVAETNNMYTIIGKLNDKIRR